jgi:predicted ATPase
VAAIIRTLGKREPTPAFVAQLHQTTNGNPFFFGELVRHLAERGELDDSQKKIAIGIESIPLDLPQSLRLVLSRRLNRITKETRNVLATAATIGRSFPFALLEAATRADPEVLLDRVDEAEEAGLLTSTLQYPETRFDFTHELIRQAVRTDLSALRQQRLHLQITDTIERLYLNTLEKTGPTTLRIICGKQVSLRRPSELSNG